jgi:hypothetical protein
VLAKKKNMQYQAWLKLDIAWQAQIERLYGVRRIFAIYGVEANR